MKNIQKNPIIIVVFTIIILCLLLYLKQGFSSGEKVGNGQTITKTGFALDTVVSVTVYDKKDEAAAAEAISLCSDFEDIFSRTKEGSMLWEFNNGAELPSSSELASVISSARYYSGISSGAFSITMGGVSSLYDFTGENNIPPDASLVTKALEHSGDDKIIITGDTLKLADSETKADLGAIAKGYIADRIKEYLESKGVRRGIIDLGGNILCFGGKPDGSNYNIGIQYPLKNSREYLCAISVNTASVVTSGVYERSFTYEGELYHHILNPETGLPVKNGLVSVTIVSDSSEKADALSTTCFVLGKEKGLELINSMEDTYAAFVDENLNIYYSDGFEALLSKAS